MSNIETLKAQREALEAQIAATRAELEKETAAKRAGAVAQCMALVKEFGLKPYEITGGKVPGRKPKAAPVIAQAPETPQEAPQAAPVDSAPILAEETAQKPAKGLRVVKGNKSKSKPHGEAATL